MDIRPFFTPSFWLTINAPFLTDRAGMIFFIILAAIVVAGIAVSLLANKRKLDRYAYLVCRKVANALLTTGIVSLVFFFFMFERVRFFGARFWFLFIVIGALAWAVCIVRFAKKEIPVLQMRDEQRKRQGKYFPSKK